MHREELGGLDPKVFAAGFSHEAMSHPGYGDPRGRLAAMDRDGVDGEVLSVQTPYTLPADAATLI